MEDIAAFAGGRVIEYGHQLSGLRIDKTLAGGDPVGTRALVAERLIAPTLDENGADEQDTGKGGPKRQTRHAANDPRHDGDGKQYDADRQQRRAQDPSPHPGKGSMTAAVP